MSQVSCLASVVSPVAGAAGWFFPEPCLLVSEVYTACSCVVLSVLSHGVRSKTRLEITLDSLCNYAGVGLSLGKSLDRHVQPLLSKYIATQVLFCCVTWWPPSDPGRNRVKHQLSFFALLTSHRWLQDRMRQLTPRARLWAEKVFHQLLPHCISQPFLHVIICQA